MLAGIFDRIADMVVGCVSVRFGGPLTGGFSMPGPSAPLAVPATLDLRYGQIPTRGGLQAYDCVLDCKGGCLNRDGGRVRAGQSCFASARLMSLRDFPTRYPALYREAIRLGILDPEVTS